jgi:hypothetical protein
MTLASSSNGPHSFENIKQFAKLKMLILKNFEIKIFKIAYTLTNNEKYNSELRSEQILALYFFSLQLSAIICKCFDKRVVS